MTRLCASELLKLRSTRVPAGLQALAVAFTALIVALIVLFSDDQTLSQELGGRLALSSGGIAAGILALLLGIVVTTGEYRHGTIVPTLLVSPSWVRVSLMQTVACALAGALVGLVSVVATAAMSFPWLAARDVTLALSTEQVVAIFVGSVCFAAVSGALGASLGTLLRNQSLTVALVLTVVFVFDPLLTDFVAGYATYSLTGIRTALVGGAAQSIGLAGTTLPPPWLAAVLLIGYTAAAMLLSIVVGLRRDISA